MCLGHETMYEGRDIALDVCCAGHPVSIVTFEVRSRHLHTLKPGAFGPGYGRGLFAPMGINEFIIRRSRNHWYQTSEMDIVADIVNRLSRGTRVLTYGSSMGGFAAINFAPMFNADCFVALSPLFDIEVGNEAEDARWEEEGRTLDFSHNFIREGGCRHAAGFAFYTQGTPDEKHAALLRRDTQATLVPLEYGGHPCGHYLNDTYRLKPLVKEVADETFCINRFYDVLSMRTPQTHYPYERRAGELAAAGDVSGAIEQMRLAVEKNGGLVRLRLRLGNLLLKKNDLDGAESTFRHAIDLDAGAALAHVRLSYVYAARGEYSAAVREMERAVELEPTQHHYYTRLGDLLVRDGQLQRAEQAMRKVIELVPDAVIAPKRLAAIRHRMTREASLSQIPAHASTQTTVNGPSSNEGRNESRSNPFAFLRELHRKLNVPR